MILQIKFEMCHTVAELVALATSAINVERRYNHC